MIGDIDMSDVLAGETSPTTVKTVTTTTVDFEEQQSVTPRTIEALVQPQDPTQLQSDTIDWSLEYIMVHSPEPVEVGEFVEHRGKDFKIVTRSPWDRYGFTEVIGEETNRPLL